MHMWKVCGGLTLLSALCVLSIRPIVSALCKLNKVLCLALCNNLYHGELPQQFQDLTWVGEKICAIYCVTAHITCMFQSVDPAQPKTFHGNTCAHEMNIVSIASVLPCTSADINSLLSVVFISPRKFDPKVLGTVFYFMIALMYPKDDILPGVSEGVIEDHELDVQKVFEEEMAGFSMHLADMLGDAAPPYVQQTGVTSDMPVVILEKIGVPNPECDKISGQACTAAALRNLYLQSNQQPDLVVHRGMDTILEYKNPDFLPDMFPTLFLA
ncbi:hypothetical protein BDR06DRAFT_968177 [Suillus hirtellus]|nr:hypothetical protein BDR06DRAFT_968177 [Suillus hirtellus]